MSNTDIIDECLRRPLDTLIYNINEGYDFLIIISGGGLTRVGKTTLAQQIGTYCANKLGTPFSAGNIAFGGRELIDKARTFPHRSVLIDDEARDDISGKKVMESFNKMFMTFLNECGKYNHLIILVATDFFDFSKSISLGRSELLIDVRRGVSRPTIDLNGDPVVKILRGVFHLYDRDGKKKLYLYGKKENNYFNGRYKIKEGRFNDVWYIDKNEYERRKDEFLDRDREKTEKKNKPNPLLEKANTKRDYALGGALFMLNKLYTQHEIQKTLLVDQQFISNRIVSFKQQQFIEKTMNELSKKNPKCPKITPD